MQTNQVALLKPLLQSACYTLLLTLVYLCFTMPDNPANEVLLALPWFVCLYFLLFSIGKPQVTAYLRRYTVTRPQRSIIFPLVLVLLYFVYVAINGQQPFEGTLFLVPYLLFFPVMSFAFRQQGENPVDGFDFLVFFLFFFPVTLVKINISGDLPINGGGFDSIYRITVMLTAVFAFVTVRDIRGVGYYPAFNIKNLLVTLGVWLLFMGSVVAIGFAVNFMKWDKLPEFNQDLLNRYARNVVSVFLHTALFEELVFRGLLQNMLGQRIQRAASWHKSWAVGAVILLISSLLIGYNMKGNMQWFPALITAVLFMIAFYLEKKRANITGAYTALVITSVIFGLVHAHAGSIIFVGLASIGGWAYGYTWLKTGNVFYAALLHALVNTTPLLLGLQLAK